WCALERAQRGARSVIAAHPVDATAGRRRCGAQEDAAVRCGVRIPPRDRPGEQLGQIRRAAGDRTADVVGVIALEVGGCGDVPREDDVAKAGSEALDLSFD